jgi:hypothetical protein
MSELMNDLAPNILLVYDNSSSMWRGYTPDSLGGWSAGGSNYYYIVFGNTADSLTAKNNRTVTTSNNVLADHYPASVLTDRGSYSIFPPMLSAAFNRQAYDPTVIYLPPQIVGGHGKLPTWARALVANDGKDVVTYPAMNKTNTKNWSWVPEGNAAGRYWNNSPSNFSLKNQTTQTISSPAQINPAVAAQSFTARGRNLNYRVTMTDTNMRILKKHFVDIEDPEVSELFTFYCDNNGNLYRDSTDNVPRLAGLTWRGCNNNYLPLHYYKTSVKWCDKENAAFDTTTQQPFWPGHSNANYHGFGDGTSDCVALTDASYDPLKHKYPYFYYPYGDKMTPRKDDNTKYNPFIPVILDLQDELRTYTHHYINEAGDLDTVTRTFEEEMTNYLNWFVYYGTRERTGRTVISRVFKDVPPYMHVGFTRMEAFAGTPIGKFGDNRESFYSSLFNDVSGTTPMKARMNDVYGYFKRKPPATGTCTTPSFTSDNCAPIKYACQRNNVIMFTDGVWNDSCSLGAANLSVTGNRDSVVNGSLPDSDVEVYGKKLSSGASWPEPIQDNSFSTCRTLADITIEGWRQDLRPDFYQSNGGKYMVPSTPADPATWPHVTFSALAFGMQGVFPVNNQSLIIEELKSGARKWPAVNDAPLYGAWADPRADDLWHAAVNGFGTYLSSQTPTEFEGNLRTLIKELTSVGGTEANAVFESGNLDKSAVAYVPSYAPGWSGDLKRVELDKTTGKQKTDAECGASCWSASKVLKERLKPTPQDKEPWMSRKIITLKDAGGQTVKQRIDFTWNDLSDNQRKTLGATKQSQEAMIAYLRGDSSNEGSGVGQFRRRTGPLGDIVNSQPVYAGPAMWLDTSETPPEWKLTWEYDDDETNNSKNPGYKKFANVHKNRKGVVYVGANDGMLHAFDAKTGEELWAYIPSNLFRNAAEGGLAALASTSWRGEVSNEDEELPQEYLDAQNCEIDKRDAQGYCPGWAPTCPDGVKDAIGFCPGFGPGDVPSKKCAASEKDIYGNCPPIDLSGSKGGTMEMFYHRYYVDATPRVMDAKVNGTWKTVLVSGLGKGGTSYFAIDVTDPDNPIAMWEFTDKNMGYTYGRPVIAKTKYHGKDDWVALMPSGYNNGTGKGQPKKGDGIARLHIAKLTDGDVPSDSQIAELLDPEAFQVVAGHGTASWPAGMGNIVGFVDSYKDQTVRVVYGGDQRGMLWRFILDDPNIRNWSASKLGYHLRDPKGNWQPVSTEPTTAVELDESGEKGRRWVFVGTGRLTSAADLKSKIGNTMYGYLDGFWDPRNPDRSRDKTRTTYHFTNRDANYMKDVSKGSPFGRLVTGNWGWAGGWYHDLPENYHVIASPLAFYKYIVYAATTYSDTVKDCSTNGAHSIIYIREIGSGELKATVDVPGAITGLTFLTERTADGGTSTSFGYVDSEGNVRKTPSPEGGIFNDLGKVKYEGKASLPLFFRILE